MSSPASHAQYRQSAGWLTPQRIALYASVLLALQVALVGMLWWKHYVEKFPGVPLLGWDFAVYWSASSLALSHGPVTAYSWESLRAMEATLHLPSFGPFAYPPTFLLMIYPIAAMPFGAAVIVWSLFGVAGYLLFIRAVIAPISRYWLFPALAFPGMWLSLVAGQNSLFTLVMGGTALLLIRQRPVLAGACIALLCIKPQLGVLFPLFLLCRRHWTAFASAAVFSMLYCGLTWLAFGTDSFRAFEQALSMFRHVVAENAIGTIRGAPTMFAIWRVSGTPVFTSYLAHTAVAVLAVATCIRLWCSNARFELSAAALAIATLLMQPYLIYYDLAWLALPIAFLMIDYARHGANAWEKSVLIASWIMPAQAFAVLFVDTMIQWTPIVLIVLLAVIVRRHVKARQDVRPMERNVELC